MENIEIDLKDDDENQIIVPPKIPPNLEGPKRKKWASPNRLEIGQIYAEPKNLKHGQIYKKSKTLKSKINSWTRQTKDKILKSKRENYTNQSRGSASQDVNGHLKLKEVLMNH